MKNILLAALLVMGFGSYAQDTAAPINHVWHQYATDTTLTYQQITHVCDSLFAQAGYGVVTDSASDSTWYEGSKYWEYNLSPPQQPINNCTKIINKIIPLC